MFCREFADEGRVMARDDMFNWLLRKKKSLPAEPQPKPVEALAKTTPTPEVAPVPETKPVEIEPPAEASAEPVAVQEPAPVVAETPEPEPVVAEPQAESIAADAPAPEPVAVETPAPVRVEAPVPVPETSTHAAIQASPAYAGLSKAKRLLVLQRSSDEVMPSAGAAVVEHAGKHKRNGVLVGVRADGRRLLAKVGPAGGIRAYTLRYDGAYRLEGVVDARAPVLTLAREA